MNHKGTSNEILIVILASIVLALTYAFKETLTYALQDNQLLWKAALSFFVILSINVLVKKAVGYHYETNVRTKFWTLQQFGFRKDHKFKKPIPMLWLPLIIALFSKGFLLWFGILEFDVEAKAERVSKRHGLYRFTEVTEWHMAIIAIFALAANLIVAIIAYVAGLELLAKLSIYFIAWSVIPIGRLDGAKIFFGNKGLWIATFAAAMIMLIWGLVI